MTYPFASPSGEPPEPSEFRRTHFRAFDENGFVGSFSIRPPENASLSSVVDFLCTKFSIGGGEGFDSNDLVVFFGCRIVAVVVKGADGRGEVTRFAE